MSNVKLHVSLMQKTVRDVDGETFVITDALSAKNSSKLRNIFVDFSSISVGSESNTPLYKLLWPHIVSSRGDSCGLSELIVLFNHLASVVRENEIDIVVPHRDLKRCHVALLEDISNECNTRLCKKPNQARSKWEKHGKKYFRIGLILTYQVFSLLLRNLGKSVRKKDVIFVPQSGREKSITPVLEEADFEYGVRDYALLRHIKFEYNRESELTARNSLSLWAGADISAVYEEIKLVGSIVLSLMTRRKMEFQVAKHISSEYGLEIPNSVRASCQRVYLDRMDQAISFIACKSLIEKTECDAVVAGGPTHPCRGLLLAAETLNTDSYLIPHGITRPLEPLAPASATMFVPGPLGASHLKNTFPPDRLPEIIATGRPYLDAQYENRKPHFNLPGGGSPVQIVLATQNFPDSIRKSFLRTALSGLSHIDRRTNVIIKTHPSESDKIYHSMIDSIDCKSSISIGLCKCGLEKALTEAHLLFTVNSNVAVESIVIGTPSISINIFRPCIPAYPYVTSGLVPELTSQLQVNKFCKNLSIEKIGSLMKEQSSTLNEQYFLGENSSRKIAKHISDSLNNT
jgi:hypothetical protein